MTTYLESENRQFTGLSRDVKPMLDMQDVGAHFFETDTRDNYIWNGSTWILFNENVKEIKSNDICLLLTNIMKESKKTNLYLAMLTDTIIENKDMN